MGEVPADTDAPRVRPLVSREERDKIRKLKHAFLNFKPLDSLVSSLMIKYGLNLRQTHTPDQPRVDPDALLVLSEACKMRMEWIIRELIKVNRGVNAL